MRTRTTDPEFGGDSKVVYPTVRGKLRASRRRTPTTMLPHLLSAAVERDPAAPALTAEGHTLTYREADAESSRLARLLIARGIGPEDRVAVLLTRSIRSVLAVWAVAKAGAAFVPVDPLYPADRVRYMLSDSDARLALTVVAHRGVVPEGFDTLVLDEPDTRRELDACPADPLTFVDRVRPLRPDHPAYVIYTSGSTGRPKGVVVTQAGLADFCAEQVERYRLTPAARTLHFASPSFDASVLELLLAVGSGSTMVVAPPSVYGGDDLAELLRRERVTHAFVTPAALASVDPTGLDDLETVVVGGEACPPDLVARWAPGRRFHNGYGPTETTIMTSISGPLAPGAPVTIGRPVRGVAARILDTRLRPVPAGTAGELYLTGSGLARGYHERPGLTATRFVAAPGGARRYRTGDLVRSPRSAREGITYLGRNDFQVKVRGFRIELGEIDAAFAAHPTVDFAATVGYRGATGDTRLVTYVHAAAGSAIDVAVLTAFVAERLPAHMIPSSVIALETIPLTPVGKLDRAALPEPEIASAPYRAPASAAEVAVAEAFGDVLGVQRVSVHDDFFDLGGNSLLATRVIGRIRAALGVTVSAADLFDATTVEALAARVAAAPTAARGLLPRRPRPDRIPLSPAQQRMWFLNRLDPDSAVFNIPLAVRLSGRLDVDAMRAAVRDVVARHETLRTVYPEVDGVGEQRILDVGDVPLDLGPEDATDSDAPARLAAFAGGRFDVTGEVPVRVRLFRLADHEHVLAVVLHHIAGDGSSLGPLVRDLVTAYTARSTGREPAWEPLPVQYADYTLWQLDALGDEDDPRSGTARQLAYWRRALDGIPEHLELATDRPRPPVVGHAGDRVSAHVDETTYDAISALARERGVTPFMVLHAVLAVLLARVSNTHDVVVGTPVAGRTAPELDGLIGMFVNMLALRTDVDAADSFATLLEQVRDTDLHAFAHADVPFERLVEVLDPVRSTARHPIFQVGFSYQNFAREALELPGLRITPVESDSYAARFDLHVTVVDHAVGGGPGGFDIEFGYATDLFDAPSVRRLLARYLRILRAVVDDPAAVVGDIDLHDSAELAEMMRAWEAEQADLSAGRTLVDLFDEQVAATPDAPALVFRGGTLTYRDFDARVNRLARHLVTQGVGPESTVALCIRRSVDLVVAMYAVAKAGGAYLPLDPDHPAARNRYILDAAAPQCVLSTTGDRVDALAGRTVLDVDRLDLRDVDPTPLADTDRRTPLRAANTAYVIYTSGSTGRPKGVAVPHEAIVNQIAWKRAHYDLGPDDAVLLKTAATFDLSVWEFWSALTCGARLVIAAPDGHRDPSYLNDVIRREKVTTLHVVPSMLEALLEDSAGALPATLRRVLAIGEVLPAPTARRALGASSADLVNLYGPTEAAVSVTAHAVTTPTLTSVPIGDPVPNTQTFVLDERMHPVPPGVAGELYLAGVQLARGYLGRPGLTAERFVANPFGDPGTRLYRTGDVVRWRIDGDGRGTLEYLERADFQVKVHGFRIELGEIEAALRAHPAVRDAAVAVHGGDRLVAFVVPAAGRIDVAGLRASLAETLPSYMVPAGVVTLDALPLNPHGKLDRAALPEPVIAPRRHRPPRTPLETEVATAYREVLEPAGEAGEFRVGLDDDFFDLGGTSLSAVRVIARLRERTNLPVSLQWMFLTPTVEALAARIEGSAGDPGDHTAGFDAVLTLRPGGAAEPVFCIHPVIGLSWSFAGLARHLDPERPLYGLQSPALRDDEPLPASIDAWAAGYVDRIRRIQPAGPYHLVGWSLGGIIAHAAAVRLRADGHEVATLALLDAHPPGAPVETVPSAVSVADLLGAIGTDVGAGLDPAQFTPEQALELVADLPAPFDALTLPRLERIFEGVRLSYRLLAEHRPARFDGDLLFFAASEDGTSATRAAQQWRTHVTGTLAVESVQATHWKMTSQDAVARIGPVLDRWVGGGR
ncbi:MULTISPECIES: non-ribosomal peptide synthetase [Rhodococcus]|uniref:amino acid adenylation domain-containing protein n=1 Tax=Rhodococcus TaxID=1827 RepID=UPI001FC9197E|nr:MULTISPECIES: non-ribosomal peptide synthetase [Rhodococcus]WML61352.1 amino acid adenylation domain-containing protein [Rhodococcus sp. AH-ZY2]